MAKNRFLELYPVVLSPRAPSQAAKVYLPKVVLRLNVIAYYKSRTSGGYFVEPDIVLGT